MLSAAIYMSAVALAYTWYNTREKRVRIELTPRDGIRIDEHMENISSIFSPTRLPSTMKMKGYNNITSHIEVRREKVIITIDARYTWKLTWDIGSLWLPNFDIQVSEIYDR